MKRKIAKRKASLAIRQIIAGAKELIAIEAAMLKETQNGEHNVKTIKNRQGGNL